MSVIGDNIRYIRERRLGMRLDFFAKELGVTPNTVINWESGRSTPRSKKVKLLFDFFKGKDWLPDNFRPNDLLKISIQELIRKQVEENSKTLQDIKKRNYFSALAGILLNDRKTVTLMQITAEEESFLRSICFDGKFTPSKQFYLDTLFDYRDYKRNREPLEDEEVPF